MAATDHVTIGGNALRCTRCGSEFALPSPCSLNILDGISKGFIADHKRCAKVPATPAAVARMTYRTPEEWARSWDTGMSSMTIFQFMKHGFVTTPSIPYDVDDLGRCVRLLRVAPKSWRDKMEDLGRMYAEWLPLVRNWGELEEMFRRYEDGHEGYARLIYKRLQDLRQ